MLEGEWNKLDLLKDHTKYLYMYIHSTWDVPEFKLDITNEIKIEEFYTKTKTFSISSPLCIYGYNKVIICGSHLIDN